MANGFQTQGIRPGDPGFQDFVQQVGQQFAGGGGQFNTQPATGGSLTLAPINPPGAIGPGDPGFVDPNADPKSGFEPGTPEFPDFSKGIPIEELFPPGFNFGDFFGGPNLPGAPSFTGANVGQSRDILGQVARGGLEGPSQNLDRASNRLRDRLSQEARVSREQVSGGRAGRGFQGVTQQSLEGIEGRRLGAFEEGLVGLERDFEQARLQGLGVAQQAGSSLGRLGLDEADQINRFAQDIFGTLTDAELEKFGLTSENMQAIIEAITQRRLGQFGLAGDIVGETFD